MTKKTRNETIVLVIILLVTVFLIYHFFFSSTPAPAVSSTATTTASPATPSPAVVSGATLVGSISPNTVAASTFLPNGAKLDTSVLNSSVYKSLVAPVYPTVNSDELGESNPFVNQQALAATQAAAANPKK
jgi:hypothetical protein